MNYSGNDIEAELRRKATTTAAARIQHGCMQQVCTVCETRLEQLATELSTAFECPQCHALYVERPPLQLVNPAPTAARQPPPPEPLPDVGPLPEPPARAGKKSRGR